MPPTFAFVLVLVAISVGGSMVLKVFTLWRQTSHAERMQRLKVLEEAMRNPATDPLTRQQLISALHGGNRRLLGAWSEWLATNLAPRRVFGAAAWMTAIGGGLTIGLGSRHDEAPGIALLTIGIGLLALPSVLRELEQRAAKR